MLVTLKETPMDTINKLYPTLPLVGAPTRQVVLVVAMQPNLGIGKAGTMPWHIPEDLKDFKDLTDSEIVVMGRKTRDSLPTPDKLLPNRLNVVITRSVDRLTIRKTPGKHPKVYYETPSLEAFIAYNDQQPTASKTIFIIGGSEIYQRYQHLATHALVTKLDRNLEPNPDRYFFDIDQDPKWYMVKTEKAKAYHNGQQTGTYTRVWYRHYPKVKHRGKLIVVEGLDGSGKDTQIGLLQKHFDAKGVYSKVIRELDGNTFTKDLARALLNPDSRDLVRPEDELSIWRMVREHTQPLIAQALHDYDYVIMNRYFYSFLAMQGGANQKLLEAYQLVNGLIRPDFIVFLDKPPREALNQAENRGDLDRFEAKGETYHQAIRDAYRKVLAMCSTGFAHEYLVQVNANQTIEEVHQYVLAGLRV